MLLICELQAAVVAGWLLAQNDFCRSKSLAGIINRFSLRQWHNLFTTKECSHSKTLRLQHMDNTTLQDKIDDATLDFTLGDALSALTKLNELATTHPDSFAIWHALTEVYF